MSASFPSVEFFQALQKELAENPSSTESIEPSEAYCGLSVDGRLFVLEFDGRVCSAVIAGGNPIDLDFVLASSADGWREALAGGAGPRLADLIQSETIRIESEADDGEALARAALPMLQAFLDQAPRVEAGG